MSSSADFLEAAVDNFSLEDIESELDDAVVEPGPKTDSDVSDAFGIFVTESDVPDEESEPQSVDDSGIVVFEQPPVENPPLNDLNAFDEFESEHIVLESDEPLDAPSGGPVQVAGDDAVERTADAQMPLSPAAGRVEEPASAADIAAAIGLPESAPKPPRRRVPPAAIVALVAIALAQIAHFERNRLATVPGLTPLFEGVYGAGLEPEWNVRDICYEKRASYAADGVMVVYAKLVNRGAQALPYPQLHVTLSGRYGDDAGSQALGHSVLEPAEYLSQGGAASMIAPGVAFEAFARLEDPGDQVSGYAIEACYRRGNGKLYCNGGCSD